MYIPNHSTITGGIYAKVTLGMYPLIESERSWISLLLHAPFEEGDSVINHVLHKTSPCIYLPIVYHGRDLCKSDFGDVPAHWEWRSWISLLLHALFEEGDPVINQVLHKTSPCIYLTIVLLWKEFMQKWLWGRTHSLRVRDHESHYYCMQCSKREIL